MTLVKATSADALIEHLKKVQYNTIQYNTIKYYTIQYSTIPLARTSRPALVTERVKKHFSDELSPPF